MALSRWAPQHLIGSRPRAEFDAAALRYWAAGELQGKLLFSSTMEPHADDAWAPHDAPAPEGFKLDAERMWRAFGNLLSPQEAAGREPAAQAHSRPLRLHTGYFDDCGPAGFGKEDDGRTERGAEDEFDSAATQSHAMCLVAFLRRLELKERKKREAQQQQHLRVEPELYIHREILSCSGVPPSPASTAGSDAEAAAASGFSSSSRANLITRGPLTVKWTGSACRTVQVAGTFSDPPWSHCVNMKYERECGAFVADMSDAVSGLKSKDVQIKFIVDGQWRLEATLPLCQDSKGNWNNRWRPQDELLPPEDSSPLTRSLFTAAARAAAAQAQTAATESSALLGAPQGASGLSQASAASNENVWWPRYATEEELQGSSAKPVGFPQHDHIDSSVTRGTVYTVEHRIFAENGRSNSTRCHLEPVYHTSSTIAENLRRVRSMSLSLSSYPRSVTAHLNPPEVLLGLGPAPHARPERAREGLSLQCGFFLLPHPDKVQTGGADAYFIAARGEGGAVAVGVADGVGEWDSFDLDPRLFAEELMQGCCEAAISNDVKGETIDQRALGLLRKGYEATRSFGSATALVVVHEGGDKIGIANIGDSAVIVLRRQLWYQMTCVFRSREQQHQFNCPFQLSRLPQPSEYEQLRASGKDALLRLLQNAAVIPQDTPESASLCSISVMEGDLVILGTDGVFDNLFDYEICGIANLTLSPFEARLLENETSATSATAVATAIGEAAAHRSRSLTARTPFMKHARQEGSFFTGGKMDDITVVACWVTSSGTLEQGSADISGFSGRASLYRCGHLPLESTIMHDDGRYEDST
ncbi:hypothetical protein Emed_006704 [Eimeria media]